VDALGSSADIRRFIGLLCGCIGLFCRYMQVYRPLCGDIGLFCGYTGLVCAYTGLLARDLACMRECVRLCVCERQRQKESLRVGVCVCVNVGGCVCVCVCNVGHFCMRSCLTKVWSGFD